MHTALACLTLPHLSLNVSITAAAQIDERLELIIQQFHTRIYRKLHLVPEIILNVSGHNELRFPWALQRMKSGGITAFCDITKG